MADYKILIAGAGELGSRYLQGLAKNNNPLEIYVFDNNQQSLKKASERWRDVASEQSIHKVVYIDSINSLPSLMDAAIISTTAASRPKVIDMIDDVSCIQNWMLEKILAQSSDAVNKIQKILEYKKAWVNTPRRISSLYKNVRNAINLDAPITMKVSGGSWGLACNAIHFLDLLSWMANTQLTSIDASKLNSDWFESKRPGNWDVYGDLVATYANGSKLILSSTEGAYSLLVEFENEGKDWIIDELSGLAKCNDGMLIQGVLLMQSEMTSDLINEILYKGRCDLPSLEDSSQMHKIFIEELLQQWRCRMDINATELPIT
jgi:hypothetical protein